MSPFKGQTGLKRILNATGYSFSGLKAAFQGEAAFRQLVLINAILIPISLFLDVRNLGDKDYISNVQAQIAATAASAAYWPGDGRSVFGGVTVAF